MKILNRITQWHLLIWAGMLVIAGCSNSTYDFNSLPDPVKSFFTITEAEQYYINEEIRFTNASEGAETYLWDFGDGTTSTDKNPSKTYTEAGLYTVKLKAVGPGGTGNYTLDIPLIDPNAVVESDSELYFIEYGRDLIRKLSMVPGSSVETVVSMGGKAGHGMTYDAVNQKIYYADFEDNDLGKVWRMNLDGSDQEELVTGLYSPYGIALDHAAGKMYIADGPNIARANLDGTNLEPTFITVPGGAMRAVAFSAKNKMIYFYEVNDEHVYIAKNDGTGVTSLIQDAYGYGIFVDDENNKVYYDDRRQTGLMQANLDGTGVVKIASVSGNRGSSGITIDYKGNKLIWAETNGGNVKRGNLDGTEVETILSGISSPRGMFIK